MPCLGLWQVADLSSAAHSGPGHLPGHVFGNG